MRTDDLYHPIKFQLNRWNLVYCRLWFDTKISRSAPPQRSWDEIEKSGPERLCGVTSTIIEVSAQKKTRSGSKNVNVYGRTDGRTRELFHKVIWRWPKIHSRAIHYTLSIAYMMWPQSVLASEVQINVLSHYHIFPTWNLTEIMKSWTREEWFYEANGPNDQVSQWAVPLAPEIYCTFTWNENRQLDSYRTAMRLILPSRCNNSAVSGSAKWDIFREMSDWWHRLVHSRHCKVSEAVPTILWPKSLSVNMMTPSI